MTRTERRRRQQRRRRAAMQRAACLALALLAVAAAFAWSGRPQEQEAMETAAPPTAPTGRFRKCYRISREFAASLPDDLLQVCGYSSWQSWHDAALKRLLGEYAARKRATKKEDKTA